MRLFLVGSNVPFRAHGCEGITAVNVVSYEIVRQLVEEGHALAFQPIFNPLHPDYTLTPEEHQELEHLEQIGVSVQPPIYPADYLGGRRKTARLPAKTARLLAGSSRVEDYYPAVRARERLMDRLESYRSDAALSLWSPEGVAALYRMPLPKIAYHADVDYHPVEARLRNPSLFSDRPASGLFFGSAFQRTVRDLYQRVWLIGFKQAHLRLMRDMDAVGTIMASNAELYRRAGHPEAFYARNTWSDSSPAEAPTGGPIKIIGHAGNLNATGTTYGLSFLFQELLPEMERAMEGLDYELHIIGGGAPAPSLKRWMSHPRIRMRGFVRDLDSELKSSHLFLLLNNAGLYQAAFTRIVVAWSMGLCLVVHARSREAIPEVEPMRNALCGSTPSEIARLIRLGSSDMELNRRIRREGRATYERHFTPSAVATRLLARLERLVRPEVTACAAI